MCVMSFNKINSVKHCWLKITGNRYYQFLLGIDVNNISTIADSRITSLIFINNPPQITIFHITKFFAAAQPNYGTFFKPFFRNNALVMKSTLFQTEQANL